MYKATTQMWQFTGPLFRLTVLGSAVVALGLAGCSSTPTSTNTISSNSLQSASTLDGLEDLLSATDMRAVEGDRLLVLKHGDVWKRMTVGFKLDVSRGEARIAAQRGWFISRQPYIERLSARASRYLYHTVKEAERRGLPTELALLPIIESSYDPAATSSAAAAGLWQFIPSTGRIYGLQQTSQYDGRRDVVESTRAAYEFLGSLYNQFGSWELALAAYNAGPGRIQQAINRNKAAGLATDYWSLRLPQETMNYVPRFLAVAQIVKNPNAYNVRLPAIANRPHFREIHVGAVSLNDISQITGLSRGELYALNPGYRGERIDVNSPMRILIPADLSPVIDARLKALASGSFLAHQQPAVPAPSKTTVTPIVPQPMPVIPTTPVTTTQSTLARTPQGATALADFANNSVIPSAPRIPVAVSPSVNIQQPVRTEPAITAVEREQILAAVRAEGASKTVDDVLKPVASPALQAQVVAELEQLAPQGTEIVDPVDGKIKITALQTSQSIAEQQGQEVSKGFAYPKSVTETIAPDSEAAQLNQGKNVIQTASDVVVVPPKGKRSTYVVVAGDSLQTIAMKNGLDWRDVAKWNQMDSKATLYVGTNIYLYDAQLTPTAVEVAAPVSKPKAVERYIVQSNDTLTGIAQQHGLSLKQLADYNALSINSPVYTGQTLYLKANAMPKPVQAAKPAAVTHNKTNSIKTESYTVQRGEYLQLLAQRYQLSVQQLVDLNPTLEPDSQLLLGQKINVPVVEKKAAVAVTPPKTLAALQQKYELETYTVQRGESLFSIANKVNIPVNELAALNQLTGQAGVKIGQKIRVPVTQKKVPEVYTVQAGDSLTAIAARYELSLSDIAQLNGLNSNSNVRIGQRLKLKGEIKPQRVETAAKAVAAPVQPTPRQQPKENLTDKMPDVYVVQAGDTLTSIARKYHLQSSYIMQLNEMQGSTVRVGQRLKLEDSRQNPAATPTAAVTEKASAQKVTATTNYTVKSGESLYALAMRYNLSPNEFAALNQISSATNLRIGQVVKVPKQFSNYRVKSGDTLVGVAARHGVTSIALAALNSLTPQAQLRIGQVIKVPN